MTLLNELNEVTEHHQVEVPYPWSITGHPYYGTHDGVVYLDEGMVNVVEAIWRLGFITGVSCQGHPGKIRAHVSMRPEPYLPEPPGWVSVERSSMEFPGVDVPVEYVWWSWMPVRTGELVTWLIAIPDEGRLPGIERWIREERQRGGDV